MRHFEGTVPSFYRFSLQRWELQSLSANPPHPKPQKSIYFSIFIDENLFQSVISNWTSIHNEKVSQLDFRWFRSQREWLRTEINSRLDLYLNLFASCKYICVVTNVLSVFLLFYGLGTSDGHVSEINCGDRSVHSFNFWSQKGQQDTAAKLRKRDVTSSAVIDSLFHSKICKSR